MTPGEPSAVELLVAEATELLAALDDKLALGDLQIDWSEGDMSSISQGLARQYLTHW